jgi:hypothetical protein
LACSRAALADLVEEQGPAVRALEQTLAVAVAPV